MRWISIGLVCVTMAQVAFPGSMGTSPSPSPQEHPISQPNACGRVLDACQNLVDAQDQSIANLKAYAKQLETKLDKAEDGPTIPVGYWILGGIIAGGVVGYALHK